MTRSPPAARWLVPLAGGLLLAAVLVVAGPVAALQSAPGAGGNLAMRDGGNLAPSVTGTQATAAAAGLPGPPGAVDTVTPGTNQTNSLMPPTDAQVRETYVTADIDVAAATGSSAERLHGRFERATFRRAWTGEAESVQRRLVRSELAAVRERLDRLETRAQTALAAFQAGTVSASTFLRRAGLVHVQATQLSRRLNTVDQQLSISTRPPYITAYQTPLDNARSRVNTLRNPVGAVLNGSLSGGRDPTDVYLLLGSDAYVMGTSVAGEFSRVAQVAENRVTTGTDQFEATGDRIVAALTRFRTLYPWADANAIRTPSINRFGNTSVYRVGVVHAHGELTTYTDGRTRNVFHEVQVLRQESLPVASTVRNETDALVLTVNATGPTRPMRIELDQAGTMAPLDGVVRVDGTVVGRTGESGTFWTVQPRGQFTVNVTVDTDSVAVTGP